jgi:glycosyltransferase involved in cell wall biosynthesis
VVVLTPSRGDRDGNLDDEGVIGIRPQAVLPNPFYRDLVLGYYSQSKLRKIVQAIDGSKVIHIATSGLLGVAGAKLARDLKLPIVGCYHVDTANCTGLYLKNAFGRLGNLLGVRLGRFLDKRAYGGCLGLCAPSDSAARAARAFFGGEITVIPNAIEVGHFRPAKTREGAFRAKYCPEGEVLAVVVGRVAREKNLDLVCEHLGQNERIKTVFVGDGPYGEHLRRRWNATVTGFLRGQELLAAFQQADVFVQLSVAETFGVSLLEAMASGLPAVILRSPGLAEMIPPDNGVEVIEQEQLPSLADRCVALVEDRERYERFSLRAREFVRQLSAEHVFPQFVEFHRKFAD